MSDSKIYYNKDTIEMLKKQLDDLSPLFWHKIMNPLCGVCMAERGREIVERGFTKPEKLDAESH